MADLNEENEQLREQCATLSDELNVVRDNQIEAENEGSVWESALNEAVAKTKKSLDERKEQMDTQKKELLQTIQCKDDQIADLQQQLSARASKDADDDCNHFAYLSPSKDAIDLNNSQESLDGEELKQCALFNETPFNKSRSSVLDGDRDKSGLPEICCDQDKSADNSMSMMFDGLPDCQTGSSMKQKEEEESPDKNHCLRVTTTEANDIFDDEIWNYSAFIPSQD